MKTREKIFTRIAALAVAFVATGCFNDLIDESDDPSKVRLWAGITSGSSRSEVVEELPFERTRIARNSNPGMRTPEFDGTLDIGVVRVSAREDADRFPDFRDTKVPVLASLGRNKDESDFIRPIDFLSQAQFFPDATSELRYAAWYPWVDSDSDPTTDDNGGVYHSDEKSSQVTIPITGWKDVMYGNVVTGSYTTGFPVMKFDHALCVFRIHVYAMIAKDEFGNDVPTADWGEITHMTLNNVPSQVRMTLPHVCKEIVDGEPVHDGSNGDKFTLEFLGEEHLALDNNAPIPFDPPKSLPLGINKCVMVSEVIAGPPLSGVLNIAVKTSSMGDAEQDVSIARNFQPGHAYDIILRFSDHGMINADVYVSEWQTNPPIHEELAANMYYDLSTIETSNCYIVRSANYSYCFNGTVKGNGEGALVGMTAADAKLNPGWVDVLWSDLPTDIDLNGDGTADPLFALQNHKLSEGKVLFDLFGYTTTNADGTTNKDNKELPARGNVILGAYDKNPAEGGKVIWTWHLWITSQPTPIGCSNGFVVLDRNLGATTDVPTTGGYADPAHGYFYQWGRPSPLHFEGGSVPTSTTHTRLDDLYPDGDYNIIYGSGDKDPGAWMDKTGPWGEHHDHMWGDTGSDYEDQQKTLFDPCPPGYFVANYAFWRDFAKYEVSFESRGVRVNRNSEDIWFPATTVLNDEGHIDDRFVGVTMRTSSVDYENGTHPYNFYYTASGTAERSSEMSRCNYAIPVRCISTTTAPAVTDLSESQTANCYIVTEPGYYKFKATVRGNGVTELWPFGNNADKQMLQFGDGMDATISPSRVDLLWWQGDFTEMRDVPDAEEVQRLQCVEIQNGGKLKDGYLEFLIKEGNFHPGNVGLAAYDAAGNILWSWHIWMPSTRPEDKRSGRKTMQDRYLGATQAPVINPSTTALNFVNYKGEADNSNEAARATFGFYYQWGRKDPIMAAPLDASGDATVNGNTLTCAPYWMKAYSNDGSGAWTRMTTIPRAAGQVRPAVAMANPLTFYYSGSGASATNSRWYTEFANSYTNAAMWGYAVWGTYAGQDFSKTFYDPCPPGYRTAFHTVWRTADNVGYGGDDSGEGEYDWTNNEGNFTTYGFVTTKNSFDRNFYPYAGRRTFQGAYENVLSDGYWTTGMPMGQYNTRTYLYSRQNTNSRQETDEGSAYGRSVRCMKE